MWWWWWRENNTNVVVVVVVVYSFTTHEAVLKNVEWARCGVDVGSIGGRVFVDGKIYRINEEVEVEVEVEEGNKKRLKRENNKNCRGGNKNIEGEIIKLWRRELKKIEEGNKIEKGEG